MLFFLFDKFVFPNYIHLNDGYFFEPQKFKTSI